MSTGDNIIDFKLFSFSFSDFKAESIRLAYLKNIKDLFQSVSLIEKIRHVYNIRKKHRPVTCKRDKMQEEKGKSQDNI